MGTPQLSAGRYAGLNLNQRFFGRPTSIANPGNRFDGRRNQREERFHLPYRSIYGVGVPYSVGWIGPSYLGYADPGLYDGPTYAQQPPPTAPPADYSASPVEHADAAPSPEFRPTYRRAQSTPEPAPGVTLVFKDGRPTEEIHNYMLTRKTLYVQDQPSREIPVDQLDLGATQKLNHDAGLEFQLPGKAS